MVHMPFLAGWVFSVDVLCVLERAQLHAAGGFDVVFITFMLASLHYTAV